MADMDLQQCSALKGDAVKLMAQCQLAIPGHPGQVADIRRGMVVYCVGGKEVGKVAAVVVGLGSQQALCLILGHLPEKDLYQSLPVVWIEWVEKEIVYLNVWTENIQALPEWHPG